MTIRLPPRCFNRAEPILKDMEDRTTSGLAAMDQLAALAREKDAAMRAARESGLPAGPFSVAWLLREDPAVRAAGIDPNVVAAKAAELMARIFLFFLRQRRRETGMALTLARSTCAMNGAGWETAILSIFRSCRTHISAASALDRCPAVRTNARMPAARRASHSIRRWRILLSLVRTTHPLAPTTVSQPTSGRSSAK